MKRTMKFLLTTMFAAMMVSATLVTVAHAQETAWWSTSGPGQAPGAAPASGNNTLPTISGAANSTATLYLWSTAGTQVTPDTTYPVGPPTFPVNTPPTSAYFAYDVGTTGAGAAGAFSITSAQIYNPNVLTAGGASQTGDQNWDGTTGASETITRWNAASNFTGTSITATGATGLDASSIPVATDSAGVANGINAGIQTGLATPVAATDPFYVTSAQNGGNGAAFLIGSVTIQLNANGTGTLSVIPSAGSLGIGKGNSVSNGTTWSSSNTSLAAAFNNSFAAATGTATLNVSTGPATRTGDISTTGTDSTPDGKINAADIDKISSDIRNATTIVATEDYRGATIGSPPDGIVNSHDLDHLVGSLVDINNGGIGGAHGTHYGDVTLDGVVNLTDINAVLAHWQATGGWASGNVNGTTKTVVNLQDINTILANWQATGGTGQVSVVPEPSSIVLVICGAAVCLLFGRRASRGVRLA